MNFYKYTIKSFKIAPLLKSYEWLIQTIMTVLCLEPLQPFLTLIPFKVSSFLFVLFFIFFRIPLLQIIMNKSVDHHQQIPKFSKTVAKMSFSPIPRLWPKCHFPQSKTVAKMLTGQNVIPPIPRLWPKCQLAKMSFPPIPRLWPKCHFPHSKTMAKMSTGQNVISPHSKTVAKMSTDQNVIPPTPRLWPKCRLAKMPFPPFQDSNQKCHFPQTVQGWRKAPQFSKTSEHCMIPLE